MIKGFLHLLVLTLSFSAIGQTEFIELPKQGNNLEDLVPENWNTLATAKGDLNSDGISDLTVVIQGADKENFEVSELYNQDTLNLNRRILGVYFGDGSGGFVKQAQSNTFIPLKDSPTMDEPFDGIEITDKGILQIRFLFFYSAGSWYTSNHLYQFRFEKDKLKLIGYDSTDTHRATGEVTSYSINFLTGKMSITRGNFTKDEPESVEWREFKLIELKPLDFFTEPFRWSFEGIHI